MLDRLLPEHIRSITAGLSRQDIESAQQVCRAWHDVLEDHLMPQPRALKNMWKTTYATSGFCLQPPAPNAPLVAHIAALCAKPQYTRQAHTLRESIQKGAQLMAECYHRCANYLPGLDMLDSALKLSDKTWHYRKLQNIISFALKIDAFKLQLDMPSDVKAAQHVVDLWQFSTKCPDFFIDMVVEYDPWTSSCTGNVPTIFEAERVKILDPDHLKAPVVWGYDNKRRPFLAMRVRFDPINISSIPSGIYTFSPWPVHKRDNDLDIYYEFYLSITHLEQTILPPAKAIPQEEKEKDTTLRRIMHMIANFSYVHRDDSKDLNVFMSYECQVNNFRPPIILNDAALF